MRSWLFVPGDSERKLEKAANSGADVLIVDLEDSVAPERKTAARRCAAQWLRQAKAGPTIYVRVNALDTGETEADLDAVMPLAPAGIMLPKAEGRASIEHVSSLLRAREAETGLVDGSTAIAAIITETPAGIFKAPTIGPDLKRLAMLTWGAEDLSAVVGNTSQRDGNGRFTPLFEFARTTTLLTAAQAGTAAIDSIHANFRDPVGLKRECAEAARDGFVGKMAIHPDQVEIINVAFTPTAEAVEEARAIVAAFAAAPGAGVVNIDGKMRDRPHLLRAQRLLSRL